MLFQPTRWEQAGSTYLLTNQHDQAQYTDPQLNVSVSLRKAFITAKKISYLFSSWRRDLKCQALKARHRFRSTVCLFAPQDVNYQFLFVVGLVSASGEDKEVHRRRFYKKGEHIVLTLPSKKDMPF